MAKTVQINKNCLWLSLVSLIGLLLIGYLWNQMNNTERLISPVQEEEDSENMTDKKPIKKPIKNSEGYRNYQLYDYNYYGDCPNRTQLTRKLSPLQYTFQDMPWYRQFPYFNYYNSPQIIGGGGRRIQVDQRHAIPNVLDPIDVSNRNIAPSTVFVDGNVDMKLQKVGTIYKIFGNENQIFGLWGRKLYHNDEKWEYFTQMGPTNEFLRVFTKRQYEELGNNDEAEVEGRCGRYRVSIYDRYMPQFVPFI